MNWQITQRGFIQFLRLEKSLSKNSIDAYTADVEKLRRFSEQYSPQLTPLNIKPDEIRAFLKVITELGLSATSQARIISGLKGFFGYLLI